MTSSSVLTKLQARANKLKLETYSLYLAARDARTPWYAKLLLAIIVAYALSPIDLIPDFIPVLGYLDDIILLPLGITLAIKLIPPVVLTECRQQATEHMPISLPANNWARLVILIIWITISTVCVIWLYNTFITNK